MKKLISILFLLLSFCFAIAQVAQFPQVYYNGQGPGGATLSIHSSKSLSSNSPTFLSTISKIGAINFTTSTESYGTATWAIVSLPSTNNLPNNGYMLYGEYYARIDQNNNYATVNTPNLNVRTGAGTTFPNITFNGTNITYYQGSIVALTGNTTSISNVLWYELYLPNSSNYSKGTGWVNGSFLILPNSQSYKIITGTVETPNFVMIWGATIGFSNLATINSTEGFYQYKIPLSWSGTITCSHPNYNTSTPTSYSYNSTINNYNFVLSNTTCITSVAPTSATASPSSIAPGGTTTLSVNGGTLGTGASWKWYSGSCGGTAVGTGNSITVSPTATTIYFVRAEGGCSSNTTCVSTTVTVTSTCITSVAPTLATASPSSIAPGGTTTLSVNGGTPGTGASWNWYSGSCGGTLVGKGSSITVSPIATTTYFVRAEGGCSSNTTCASTTVTVTSTCITSVAPTSATASPSSIAQGGTTTLAVNSGTLGTGASWNWYSGSCGGTAVGIGNSITVSPTATTIYFVRAEGGCSANTTCANTTVTVTSTCITSVAPTSATASPSSIAPGGTSTLTVNGGTLGTGASWKWYSGSCGGIAVGTGNSITVSPTATTTYFFRAEGGCSANTTCANTTVTVTSTCITSVSPTSATASSSSIAPGGTSTLTVNGGTLGTGASWKWYSGSCGGTAVGTGSSITVSPTATTIYFVRAEGGCSANSNCANTTVTVTAGCVSSITPTSATASPATINSVGTSTLSVNGGTLGTGASWKWYSGSCGGTAVGTGSSITVSPTATTTYWVRAEGGCSANSNCANTTVTLLSSASVITITSSVIPPWQREGDDFNGQINVSITPTFKPWKLEVYRNGSTTPIKIYNVNSGNQQPFSSTEFSTPPLSLLFNGDDISYYVAFQDNTGVQPVTTHTKIIEKKWDKKNVVYYNSFGQSINVPIKYIAGMEKIRVVFKMDTKTSTCAPCLNVNLVNNLKLNNSSTSNLYSITVDNTSYSYFAEVPVNTNPQSSDYKENIVLNNNTSNISSVEARPSVYIYAIDYYQNNGSLLKHEEGKFDLTKIGKVTYPISNSSGTNANRLMILIGGIRNTVEEQCQNINKFQGITNNVPSLRTSRLDMSIISYFNALGYNTWYIAQPNINGVRQNAYDIGIALESILKLNPSNDINIICHSKGGLEIKALLGTTTNSNNLTEALDGSSFNYIQSGYANRIHKVAFLATPHRGSLLSYLGNISEFGNSAGYLDLLFPANSDPNHILYILNNTTMPTSTKFLNLTDFLFDLLLGDDAVSISSSEAFRTNNNNNFFQLYQSKSNHEIIHHNNILSNNAICSYNGNQNLDYIESFFYSDNYNLTCIRNNDNSFTINTIKSILSNAKIAFKSSNDSAFEDIGVSDENGMLDFKLFDKFSNGDSIQISANGVDTEILPISLLYNNMHKLPIAMFASTNLSSKVQYASASLLNQNPITNQPTTRLKISGKNVTKFLISQHNSDTIFISVTPVNNIITASLDTGYNRIIIKFIGVDTVTLTKDVYFLPDTLMNVFARDITINVPSFLSGCKLFVNNIFYQDIQSTSTIKFLKEVSEVKFTKYGFRDTVFKADTINSINLRMQPYSYSSLSDSGNYNFSNLNPQYWKNISLKNISSTLNLQISVKQYDDAFTGMALQPQCRKFVFKNLAGNSNVRLRTAIALDQIDTPDSASVYLLTIKNGQYKKYHANQTNVTEYDPEVQKLAFDSIQLNANETEEIVLMKKQAPVLKFAQLSMVSGGTKTIPLDQLVTDPDSIKNDITATIQGSTNPDISSTIKNGNLVVTCKRGYVGILPVTFTAEHDFIQVTKAYYIIVNPPDIPVNIPHLYPNPTNDYINIEYILSNGTKAGIKIYNKLGQLVKVIDKSYESSGYYNFQIDVRNLAAGVYTVRLNDNKTTARFVKF